MKYFKLIFMFKKVVQLFVVGCYYVGSSHQEGITLCL